jgi:hypothetical protein
MSEKKNKADLRLLAVGALAGLAMAGVGILRQEQGSNALPEGSVARVNDVLISRELYDRAVSRATDYAGRPVEGDDTMMLQRLIDAELLIQRGVELGMTQSDAAVRQAIIDSLIASITAEADAANPTDDELKQHLADNADRFSYIAKVSVDAWQTDEESAAQELIAALRAGETAQTSDIVRPMPDLPSGIMNLEVLADYVGPGIAAAVAEMPIDGSAVFARRGRWLVIRINEKERETLTDLGAVRNRVLIDYRRTLADRMLRTYIENLRQRALISVAEQ